MFAARDPLTEGTACARRPLAPAAPVCAPAVFSYIGKCAPFIFSGLRALFLARKPQPLRLHPVAHSLPHPKNLTLLFPITSALFVRSFAKAIIYLTNHGIYVILLGMDTKPKTLQQAIRYFADEQVCIDTVAAMRWPSGPICPKCEHREHYYLATQKRWKCKKCGKQFSVKVGTIFEDSPISLDKWLAALWMLVNCKNGISSYEVGRDLGLTQKSAWFVLHRLRLALQKSSLVKIGGKGSEVEVDETFIGGKARFMSAKRRQRLIPASGVGGKTVVIGMLDRGGEVRANVIPTRRKHHVEAEVLANVKPDSSIYTDALHSYDALWCKGFQHESIDHAERYVDGKVHTNGLENFWSLLKRGLKGTYISVEPFHLFRYLDEQTWRYNNRATKENPMNDGDRFELALSQIAGKRLTFAEVTGKVGETTF